MNSFEFNSNRLFFVYACIVIGFFTVAFRLLFLIIFSDEVDVSQIYDNQEISRRSDIVDRNGIIVATDLDVKVLYANTTLIRNPEFVTKQLANTFSELNPAKLIKKLSKSKDGWILIKRNITPKQERMVNNLGIAGLIFEDSKIRVYPQKSSLSHVVGYTDLDGNGIAGIEKEYDTFLKEGSSNLQLSLDTRVQDVLNFELSKAIKKYKSYAAFGIIMDVNNGEIIALSSLPNFDRNNQSEANDKAKFNRVTYGVYELGSVFKIFNHALAFENKAIRLKDPYTVKNKIKYDQFTIDDYHKDKDILSVEEIFTQSSNIGSVKIAQTFEPKSQQIFFKKIGLLDQLNLEFPSLGKPIYPKRWGKISRATIAFGHGIAITPLHITRSVSSIVNGGSLFDASLLKLDKYPTSKEVISKETSDIMNGLLRKTVQEGTGRNANIDGYEIGGKTGTAERAEAGGYNKKKTIASFVAAFPMSNPKYVVFIGLDQPNYFANTGGIVAAPVVGKIIKNIAPILAITNK
jgi:cell division protein FtsI (penicillin-binding protein 3)